MTDAKETEEVEEVMQVDKWQEREKGEAGRKTAAADSMVDR